MEKIPLQNSFTVLLQSNNFFDIFFPRFYLNCTTTDKDVLGKLKTFLKSCQHAGKGSWVIKVMKHSPIVVATVFHQLTKLLDVLH